MTKDAIEETLAKYSRGLIMVFTGDGKGKTTAALGQALRALGHGKKVLVIQFMKGRKYGEVICAEQCLPNLTVRLCGLDSFVMRENPAPLDIELARQGLAIAREIVDRHEGRIEATSNGTPGEGAVFSVWLPAASAPS